MIQHDYSDLRTKDYTWRLNALTCVYHTITQLDCLLSELALSLPYRHLLHMNIPTDFFGITPILVHFDLPKYHISAFIIRVYQAIPVCIQAQRDTRL